MRPVRTIMGRACRLACLSLLALSWGCGDEAEPVDNPDASTEPPSLSIPAAVDLDRYDPQLYRDDELSLAGPWLFAFDPDGEGAERQLTRSQAAYEQTIEVPFPWQSVRSGVGPEPPDTYPAYATETTLQTYRGTVWYGRSVEVPEEWPAGDSVWLRFGAVDWQAEVFIDGQSAGSHVGGFTPFEIEVGPDVGPGDTFFVAVRVDDPCDDDPSVLLGKQGGFWYTCSAGIWQDVLLFHRPSAYLAGVVDQPADETGRLTSQVTLAGPPGDAQLAVGVACIERGECGPCGPVVRSVPVTLTGEPVAVEVGLELPEPTPRWHPDRPCLLGRRIELESADGTDSMAGYAALRDIRVDWAPGHGPSDTDDPLDQYQSFYVAGRPTLVRGVLDQGYHPLGIFQYPSRDARIDDLEAIRAMGFNAVRVHIKPEPPYVYAACDALGLLVIYDLPSPLDFAPSGPEAPWVDVFDATLEDLLARDANHPSILWWVVFNEAWGLLSPRFWLDPDGISYVLARYQLAKGLAPTRPVEDNSPGGFSELLDAGALPHVATDVISYHLYDLDPAAFARRIEALVMTTFPGSDAHWYGADAQAGQPLVISEFGGLSALDTRGDGTFHLHAQINAMRRFEKIQGYVLTQAYDVEWERNGLLTYDRLAKETGLSELGLSLPDLLGDTHLILGPGLPIRDAAPGDTLQLEVGLASVEAQRIERVSGELRERGGAPLDAWALDAGETVQGFGALGSASVPLPADEGIYVVTGEADGPAGPVARAALYVIVDGGGAGGDGSIATTQVEVPEDGRCIEEGACWCPGDCQLTITAEPPSAGRYRVHFEGELAAYDPEERQTDPVARPSNLTVLIDGTEAGAVRLDDAPDDHRGVLSLARHLQDLRGSYGSLYTLDLGEHDLGETVVLTLRARGNGVRLFFRSGGRFLLAPQLLFEPAR